MWFLINYHYVFNIFTIDIKQSVDTVIYRVAQTKTLILPKF